MRILSRRLPLFVVLAACVPGCEPQPDPARGETPGGVAEDALEPAGGGAGGDGAETTADRPAQPGAVTGFVRYVDPPPEKTTMYVHEAAKELEAHTTIVDAETSGLKNAVVWIERAPVSHDVPSPPEIVVDQHDFTFLPHVLAVRAGQQVRFTNSDGANHNVHSFSRGHEFNLGAPPGAGVTRTFRRPTGANPVRVECDVHSWMLAWIYVFEHPYFSVTDHLGRFRIEGVPPGSRTLSVHHADGGLAARQALEVDGDTEVAIDLTAAEDEDTGEAR